MSDEKMFLLEEYKALRKEIEIHIAESRTLERSTFIAVGAIWGWLIHERITDWRAWTIPVLLTLSAGVRLWAINDHFAKTRAYLQGIERQFGVTGWEHRTSVSAMWPVNIITGALLIGASLLALWTRDALIPREPVKVERPASAGPAGGAEGAGGAETTSRTGH